MFNQPKSAMSVVIATLGADCLAKTIECLNQGSVVPEEILICIPVENMDRVAYLKFNNIRILPTNVRGQVPQRILGFNNVSHEVVMQLDDDISVDEFCVERLLETLHALGPEVAVAPALLDQESGSSVYKKSEKNRFLLALYYWLMNGSEGFAPGRIDKSGSSVGLDPAMSPGAIHDVEWLAGGCVIHYKKNLVLENFWPLPGKAYYEDVVHSYLLRQKGIRLVIETTARCSIELFSHSSFQPREFVVNLYRDYLGRRYFMRRFSRNSPRIYLFYVTRILSYLRTRFRA